MRRWQLAAAAGIMGAGALAAWCFREELTARAIAERSPGQGLAAAAFLIGLYALKGLSLTFPISALTAAGGLLFPYPEALAVNLTGVAAAHLGPFLLGRRQEGGLEALTARYPKIRVLRPPADHRWRTVFLLRLAGATPGDLVSMYLGAAGVPLGTYLSAGLLGAAPRVAAATALGSALWSPGSPRFWTSLGLSAALTVLAAALWRGMRE
nr:VTT domain-containing protein [uncultured Oscillibacter sp.]